MIDEESEMLADAAAEVVDCMRVLTKSGSNLVAEVLGGREFVQFQHYPENDVLDRDSYSQYYFHAHPPERGEWNDYGHFHLFVRGSGIPGTAKVLRPSEHSADAIVHLIAISMDRYGRPVRLFTTNRWVTDESWLSAGDMRSVIDGFSVDLSWPSWPLNRWLTAMVKLYRDQIEQLLLERDQNFATWQEDNPGSNAFEDRSLEVISSVDIDLNIRLSEIRQLIGME